MKVPKLRKRHCPHCNKHTEQKVSQSKGKGRSKARPLSRMGTARVRMRGQKRGAGNLGKYGSKPPIKNWKLTGKKQSKKTDFRFECTVCKKKTIQKEGLRAKKVELI